MNLKDDYALLLKSERLRKGLTQVEAAKKIGISRSYYTDIENGRTLPSGRVLFEINNVLPIFLITNDANGVNHMRKRGENK